MDRSPQNPRPSSRMTVGKALVAAVIAAAIVILVVWVLEPGSSSPAAMNTDGYIPTEQTNEDSESPEEYYEFYNTYLGDIGGADIEMKLITDEGVCFNGDYWFIYSGRPVHLQGQIVDGESHLVLKEYFDDIQTGTFDGIISDGVYSGTWSSHDGSRVLPFNVTYRP